MRRLVLSALGAFVGYLAIRFLDGLVGIDPEAWGEQVRRTVVA